MFLAQQGGTTKGFVLDEALFDSLKPKIKSALGELFQAEGIGPSARGEIYGNFGGLNRKSFAQLLTGFLNYIGLTVPPQDLQLFIQCRNKLVHTGEFYCEAASADERKNANHFRRLPTSIILW